MSKTDGADAEAPICLESGELACPGCRLPLVRGMVPYMLKGRLLGSFDGLRCPGCSFGLLSERGYEDSGELAVREGHVRGTLGVGEDGSLSWHDGPGARA